MRYEKTGNSAFKIVYSMFGVRKEDVLWRKKWLDIEK